jgi:FdrA protein
VKKALVQKDSYFDSVFLMSLSKKLKAFPGLDDAVVAMATPMNIDLLISQGYDSTELSKASPNDLVIAVNCVEAAAIDKAFAAAKELLERKKTPAGAVGAVAEPASLAAALELLPDANLAVISLPGAYAAREARKALERGLHVMLFSDNVSLEDEIALKELGRSKGLLVMGPDCGTAIINGKPLCFANAVRRGPIGVVAASGTGLQEVTCLIDRLGSGVSQAIGTGGRDLKNESVGGITMLMGIEALSKDPGTEVIVVVSKPPATSVAQRVMEALRRSGKPSIVQFIGMAGAGQGPGAANAPPNEPRSAASLEEAAAMAVALTGKRRDGAMAEADFEAVAEREAIGLSASQKYVRGYYTGGTLADEAMFILHRLTGAVYSNNQTESAFVLPDPKVSVGHTIVDLGDDAFTVGRPHPMIDPSARIDRIEAELGDPEIAVILVDVVLGYGSHADPAGAILPALSAARKAATARGGYLPVIASVIGTPADFQGYASQAAKLEAEGCVVMPSNFRAARMAARIIEKATGARPGGGQG